MKYFDNLKTGNIEKKLIELSEYANELEVNKYNKHINKFISNIKEGIKSYKYTFTGECEDKKIYEFTVDRITYGFEDGAFVYIKVADIVIFHNRSRYSDNGKFENVSSGWNHKLPKEMIKQIKQDSKIISNYIKNIKHYLKYSNDNKVFIKHKEEQEQLNEIFCQEEK